MAEMQSNLEQK
jgi:hypothetical protein